MAYEGGYTSAVNSATRRSQEEAQTQALLQAIAQSGWKQQQVEEEKQKQKSLDIAKFQAARDTQLGPPPQPMAPGQPSQPMQGPPPMMASMGPPPPGAMPQPPAGLSPGPPPAGMSPQGAVGAPPQGWKPSAAAPPILGGQPPMGAGGPGGQIGAPPMGAGGQEPVLPPKLQTMESAIQTVEKMKLPDDQKWPVLQAMGEMMSKQNKEALEKYRIDEQVKAVGVAAMREARLALEKPTAKVRDAEYVFGKDTPEAREAVGKQVAKAGTSKYAEGAAVSGDYAKDFKDMNPRQQAAVDWYSTMQIGGDSTWRTGLSRIKGGAELIKAVDEHVPEKAKELGLSAPDVGTNRAKRVASQAALNQNTKDITGIKPFAKMLDQNAEILKGLAAKIIKTDSALLNRPINYLQTHVGSNPDVAEFLAQMRLVQTEAARVITNPRLVGQLTDESRREMDEIINGNMSLGATNQVLDRLVNDSQRRVGLMEEQQQSLQSGIKEMMGGTSAGAGTVDETVLKGGVKVKGRGTEAAPYMITGDEQYKALDSGKFFVGPDQQLRKKP